MSNQRFWSKVDKTDSCWNWTGSKDYKGYGRFSSNGKTIYAHRFSFEITKGEIPEGLQIDHLCRNTSCVNPQHLESVTQQENISRSSLGTSHFNSNKTHCKNGHEFTKENTGIEKRKNNHKKRYCKTCKKIKNQVVMVSTTTHGYMYQVYLHDDTERKKIIYTGEISDEPKHSYCECKGWVIKEKCYHNDLAKSIMEISIV